MDSGFSYPFFEGFVIDLANYLVCVLIYYVLYVRKIIPINLFIIFCIYSLTPFLFNNVLFSWTEFYDQKKYLILSNEIRNHFFEYGNLYPKQEGTTIKVYLSSLIFSLLPTFSFFSINSIAFLNKLILCGSLSYIYFRRMISENYLIVLLLFPSVAFFSSLSLRDTIVLAIMLIMISEYFSKNYLSLTVFGFFLAIIKFQNFIFFFVIVMTNEFYKNINKNYNLYYAFIYVLTVVVILVLGHDFILDKLNFYREGLYLEQHGEYRDRLAANNYLDFYKLSFNLNSLILLFSSFLNFMLAPIGKIDSLFSIVAILEIFMFLLLFITVNKNFKGELFMFRQLLFLSFFSLTLAYSLLPFNEITIIRYRFPIFIFFLTFLHTSNHIYQNKK